MTYWRSRKCERRRRTRSRSNTSASATSRTRASSSEQPAHPGCDRPGIQSKSGEPWRLVVANLLTQAHRPRYLRTAVHHGSLGLYELNPATAPDLTLRPPQEIEASAVNNASTIAGMLHHVLPDAAQQFEICDPHLLLGTLWEASLSQDVAQMHRSGLLLALACQLHYREHGEFPASLDDLVKSGYLKSIPADPFGKGKRFATAATVRRCATRCCGASIRTESTMAAPIFTSEKAIGRFTCKYPARVVPPPSERKTVPPVE